MFNSTKIIGEKMSFVELSANVREYVRELFVEVNCVRNK